MEPGSHMKKDRYKAIVIGVSAGGRAALSKLFSCLPDRFPLPVIIVQHVRSTINRYRYTHFNNKCTLTIKEADDKEEIQPGSVYFAPPDYHLLIERDKTFSLSIDARVNYSRPSIDVLFESAVYVWSSGLIGILLTGASSDGAYGMQLIKEHGGLTIVQDPATAEYPVMPKAAIDAVAVDKILSIESIGEFLADSILAVEV
ncbi:MAG: chemotaxis protein CheB [Desulfobacterales bacterium]|nr:chemotaxis protein CheB [Desulfobacterales bacterium]